MWLRRAVKSQKVMNHERSRTLK